MIRTIAWQYTNEFRDAHTRAVVVRGGSNYYPTVSAGTILCLRFALVSYSHAVASIGGLSVGMSVGAQNWYFPNGLKMRALGTHGKYFLMSDSYERAGTIGFRCAADMAA